MGLAVLSNERLGPWINWSTLGPPLLEPLARVSGGSVIAPPPLRWDMRREWARTVRAIRQADALFWMQGSARPELPLVALSMTGGRVRRAAFVVDAWKLSLRKIALAAKIQRLNPCFVAFREGCEEWSRLYPSGRFEWLPFGADTSVFKAGQGNAISLPFGWGVGSNLCTRPF